MNRRRAPVTFLVSPNATHLLQVSPAAFSVPSPSMIHSAASLSDQSLPVSSRGGSCPRSPSADLSKLSLVADLSSIEEKGPSFAVKTPPFSLQSLSSVAVGEIIFHVELIGKESICIS
jgi:hypothetical protein